MNVRASTPEFVVLCRLLACIRQSKVLPPAPHVFYTFLIRQGDRPRPCCSRQIEMTPT
jgi:hypothetical protein